MFQSILSSQPHPHPPPPPPPPLPPPPSSSSSSLPPPPPPPPSAQISWELSGREDPRPGSYQRSPSPEHRPSGSTMPASYQRSFSSSLTKDSPTLCSSSREWHEPRRKGPNYWELPASFMLEVSKVSDLPLPPHLLILFLPKESLLLQSNLISFPILSLTNHTPLFILTMFLIGNLLPRVIESFKP